MTLQTPHIGGGIHYGFRFCAPFYVPMRLNMMRVTEGICDGACLSIFDEPYDRRKLYTIFSFSASF